MELSINTIARIIIVGVGATAIMDLWLILLKKLNIPTLNFAFLGRWVGHAVKGQWFHPAISKTAPIQGELALGWCTHYAIGILFSILLILITGTAWLYSPTLLPALLVGLITVTAPLLVLQPAMGAGLASRNTPTPLRNCLKSIINHLVFGGGLYMSAWLVNASH
ncbi:DUF2938 domain-containing protein [Alkanindiges illinoisensis]|uniref:DUF2938 domain-containing protein n=1 Tax=Alkanindiges illinoisensis TaxID=197183 RepID=UPI0005568965|nr:DUF2938 domain-containing protein [Alkanindiges illinoisensis]